MSNENFTKGEWVVKKGNKKALEYDAWIESNGKIIFVACGSGSRKSKIANAHLISAAHEMYEALRQILDSYIDLGGNDIEYIEKVKKLLAKARGEK